MGERGRGYQQESAPPLRAQENQGGQENIFPSLPAEILENWALTPELNDLRLEMTVDRETFAHLAITVVCGQQVDGRLQQMLDYDQKIDPKVLQMGYGLHDMGKGLGGKDEDTSLNQIHHNRSQTSSYRSHPIETADTRTPEYLAATRLHGALGGYALLLLPKFMPVSLSEAQLKTAAQLAFAHHELPQTGETINSGRNQASLISYARNECRSEPEDPLLAQVYILQLVDVALAMGYPRGYRMIPGGTPILPDSIIIQELERRLPDSVLYTVFGKKLANKRPELITAIMAGLHDTRKIIPPDNHEWILNGLAVQGESALSAMGATKNRGYLENLRAGVWAKHEGRLLLDFFRWTDPKIQQIQKERGERVEFVCVPQRSVDLLQRAGIPVEIESASGVIYRGENGGTPLEIHAFDPQCNVCHIR